MYAWLWRHLPGDPVTRVGTAFGAVLLVAVVLWYLVFPWLEPKLQFDHGTVSDGGTSAPATPHP